VVFVANQYGDGTLRAFGFFEGDRDTVGVGVALARGVGMEVVLGGCVVPAVSAVDITLVRARPSISA
jgi:hypothetical protein